MTGQIVGDTEWNGLPMPRRLWAILAVTFGVALSVLDGTIANVALPTIAHELGVSSADSIWVVNAYQLAIVVSLLSFSTLGDVVGYRRIYIGGLVFFTLSSVGCAFAGSLEMLIAMRVIQGFGGAAVVSINTSIIRIIYPRDQLGRGMGINATVVAIASVAGPTLAAAILSMASWHWLFAINIPIGIAAVWLSMRFLPYNPVRLSDRRFDWRDGVMNALTFGLLIASVEGFSHGLDPRIVACGVSAFCVVGYLFVRSQLRKPYPLLPFDLLRIPIFSLSVFTSICSFVAQMLALVALPFFLQKELGYSDVQTGLLLTAWPAVIVVVAPVAGLLVERVHAGVLGGVGLTVMAAGLLLLALLPDHPTDGAIIWRLVVCGAGFGLFQSPNNSILIASAPAYRSGSASGMLATARLIGQTTGAALMALFFEQHASGALCLGGVGTGRRVGQQHPHFAGVARVAASCERVLKSCLLVDQQHENSSGGITPFEPYARVADALRRVAVGAESRHGARGAESRVACDVLRPCDLLDAPLGVGLCIDDFVATGQQHYAARPEDHGRGAVAHHVDPIERSAERDGVDARHEKVGEQSFAPYFELFGSRQGGIESVDEFIAAAVAQLFDDPCGAQRHRIAVRDRPRCAAGDLVAQPPARFGQVGDAHGFETVAAELSGAGGEARREVGCFVLHD